MLELKPIADLRRRPAGEVVSVVAVAEEGRIIVMPNRAELTVAKLVNGPDVRHQMRVMARGREAALLVHGQSVLVRGQLVNDVGERGLFAFRAAVAGSDGFRVPHFGTEDCALCEFELAHTH